LHPVYFATGPRLPENQRRTAHPIFAGLLSRSPDIFFRFSPHPDQCTGPARGLGLPRPQSRRLLHREIGLLNRLILTGSGQETSFVARWSVWKKNHPLRRAQSSTKGFDGKGFLRVNLCPWG